MRATAERRVPVQPKLFPIVTRSQKYKPSVYIKSAGPGGTRWRGDMYGGVTLFCFRQLLTFPLAPSRTRRLSGEHSCLYRGHQKNVTRATGEGALQSVCPRSESNKCPFALFQLRANANGVSFVPHTRPVLVTSSSSGSTNSRFTSSHPFINFKDKIQASKSSHSSKY